MSSPIDWRSGDRCRTVTNKCWRLGTIVQTEVGDLAVIWDDQIVDEDLLDESGMTYGSGIGFVGPVPGFQYATA